MLFEYIIKRGIFNSNRIAFLSNLFELTDFVLKAKNNHLILFYCNVELFNNVFIFRFNLRYFLLRRWILCRLREFLNNFILLEQLHFKNLNVLFQICDLCQQLTHLIRSIETLHLYNFELLLIHFIIL